MSRPKPPEPCSLIVGLLLARGVDLDGVLGRLAEAFSPAVSVSRGVPFLQAAYYEQEMGVGIRRFYAGLEGLWDPGDLASIKERTNELEGRWIREGRRRVNLDPGLLNVSQLVLASGKPAGHRVYLRDGIYAEVEYVYVDGTFRPQPWTYPDYREWATIAFFNEMREMHKGRRRGRAETGTGRNGEMRKRGRGEGGKGVSGEAGTERRGPTTDH